MASAAAQHRQSFNELRGHPPSPRSQRQPSMSQLAVQELIDNPPMRNAPDPKFAGRDWKTIQVQELTEPEDVTFVDIDTSVEAATKVSTLDEERWPTERLTEIYSFSSNQALLQYSSARARTQSSGLLSTEISTPTF